MRACGHLYNLAMSVSGEPSDIDLRTACVAEVPEVDFEYGSAFAHFADKADIGAEHRLSFSHDTIGKVTQPNFRSRFVARFIVSDGLLEFAEILCFFVSADLGQPHRIPRGYSALWGM